MGLRGYSFVSCVLGALVIAMLARPMFAVRRIGLDEPTLLREGHCSLTGRIWQQAVCYQGVRDFAVPSYTTSMQLSAWTRQLTLAARTWSTADSAAWRARIDSVRGEMRSAHYDRVTCDPSETGFTIGEAWRTGGGEIRLYGGQPSWTGASVPLWYVSVLLLAGDASGCGRPPRRELHLELLPRLIQQWIASQLDLSQND